MKKKIIPVLVAILLILIVIAAGFGTKIIEKYSYSKERVDLRDYYSLVEDNDEALILQDDILEA